MIRRIALGLVTAVAIPVAMVRAARWARGARVARIKRTWIAEKIEESNRKLDAGDHDEALSLLLRTLEREYSAEPDDRLLTATARLLSARGEHRALAALRLCTDEFDAVIALEAQAPREAALAVSRRGDHAGAAKRFEAIGEPVHAAIAFERAGEPTRALALWTQLSNDPRVVATAYHDALCRTKLGRALRAAGEDSRGLDEIRSAIQLARRVMLEYAAHPFGRAFDAASLVVRLADEIGDATAYREALEWCLADYEANRMDGYALQSRVGFARRLRDAGHAIEGARFLARGVEHAARIGASWEAALAHEAADAFEQAARALYDKNAFDEARAAWSEAAERFAARNEFGHAAMALEAVATIPTLAPEVRAESLARASTWRAREDWRAAEELPDFARSAASFSTVEDDDLLALENDGDAARVCGDLLVGADPFYMRRPVGLALIESIVSLSSGKSEQAQRLAKALSNVHWYAVLDVVEKLLRDVDPGVRASAASALRLAYFPRTFELLGLALDDADERVRSAGRETLRQLHPPNAAMRVREIVVRAGDASTRSSALASLGRTQSDAAVDVLIEFAVSGHADVRSLATSLLVSHAHKETDARIRFALASVEKRILAAAEAKADRSTVIAEGEVLVAIQSARKASRDEEGNERGPWGLRMRRRVRSIRERRDG